MAELYGEEKQLVSHAHRVPQEEEMPDVTEYSIINKGGGLTGYWRQRAGSWGRQAVLSDLLKKGKTAAQSPVCQSTGGVGETFVIYSWH